MNELALFAGAGGGILGGKLLGWRTACAVEINAYCRKVLLARQRDGTLEPFPIWDDVKTFDGRPWRKSVDVVSGGFPCQDISCAGKGAGIGGERSGLWTEFARIVGEVQPRFVFVENSPMLTSRGLGIVLGDLSCLGYDAKWGIVSAENAGALHERKRLWIVAYANEIRFGIPPKHSGKQHSSFLGKDFRQGDGENWKFIPDSPRGEEDNVESVLCRRIDGNAVQVERLKALGDGQVPAVVRLAWEILSNNELEG